ncbi:type VII secretion protein EccB [Streptomyces lasiicapitis]|uniref:Type VII secretion protein EccB n=1 Tax=Streptomyces lasiicapitis TaxID=1923961 RepID=A0ABQ2MRC6_9ACTN|nr:type VII secretion protein EccB [Streptomyces lasiicapitis]GGO56408.1 type VII secretion protein EccB [Streptomyces lasiicapitis]
MASRRDELNAYTFAKRRTLAAFIQPTPSGSEETAPRPLRGVLPGLIVGVIVLAVFGAWGMLKPAAKPGWDTPKEHVIIASDSTTRYVVLKTDGKRQLHPVLNMASAKLLLDADKGGVVNVDESILDKGDIPHGATIGIPYAPDRLPSPSEAGATKRWAVCERPGKGGRVIQKAVFVLAERERDKTDGRERLRGGELLYVVSPDGTRYVVDAQGRSYRITSRDEHLLSAVVGSDREPQRVSRQWLDTLHRGDRITFPEIDGKPGADAHVAGLRDEAANRIGMVLRAPDGAGMQHYVVLRGRIAPVSDFTAKLLLGSPELVGTGQRGQARDLSTGAFSPGSTWFAGKRTWPTEFPKVVNETAKASTESSAGTASASGTSVASGAASGRNTVCSVLRDVDDNSRTQLSTWAGEDFPATLPTGSSSAYVTPGSGQFYRQFTGSDTKVGSVFLVTDTGLRYAMQSNSDSATDDAGIGMSPKQRKQQQQEARQAQTRLGYADVDEGLIPLAWSTFLPTGPRLSTAAARQPQGS